MQNKKAFPFGQPFLIKMNIGFSDYGHQLASLPSSFFFWAGASATSLRIIRSWDNELS
jgi:hypothetical protein